MPVDLSKPLDWKTATGDAAAMLDQLQPNILKGHVREHMRILFVQFDDKAEGRAFLKAVTAHMKSAKKHLQEVEAHKADGTPGTTYVGVGLTFDGYVKLGIAQNKIPSNAASRLVRGVDALQRLAQPPRRPGGRDVGRALPQGDPRGRSLIGDETGADRSAEARRDQGADDAEGQAARPGGRPRPAQRQGPRDRALRLHRRPQPAAVSDRRDRRRVQGAVGSGASRSAASSSATRRRRTRRSSSAASSSSASSSRTCAPSTRPRRTWRPRSA